MGTIIISTLQRGGGGTAPFPTTRQEDAALPHIIVADSTARDAVPEWRRVSFMTCYVISEVTTYRLGVDTTIVGQVWTNEGALSQFQITSEKNQASGYVGLNAEGFIDPQYIRSIYVQDYFTVADEAERLALVAVTGDICYQLDNNNVYIKKNNSTPPTTNSDWADITPVAAVSSVNGQTGAVNITINSLLAWLDNTNEFNTAVGNAPAVTALNGQVATNTADIVFLYNLLAGITGEADSLPVYGPSVQYAPGNVVLYDAGSGRKNLYRCKISPAVGTDPTNEVFWELIGDFYTRAELDAMLALKADLVNGTVPLSQLDLDAINKLYVVDDQAALTALQPSLVDDDRVLVMEALSNEFPDGGVGEYVYKPLDANANGLGYVSIAGASSKPLDWDRPIKKLPTLGLNIGEDSVVTGLEEMFFGSVYPTIDLNDIVEAEVGSSSQGLITGTVYAQEADTIDEIRIIRQSDTSTLTTVTPQTPPANTPISYSAPAVTMLLGTTESYYVEVDYTVGSDSGTITSDVKTFAGVYPILVGNGATGLTGSQIYALNKVVTPQQNIYYPGFSGTERLYFAFPDTYDSLASIIDQHKDELFGSLFGAASVVSISSTGLAADWTQNYKVYESSYDAITANERYGFLFTYEEESGGSLDLDPSDRAKLDSIEFAAEVNPSAAEIKTLYESNADTNAFDDGDKAKLTGIETGAEVNQTDGEIKVQYENNPDTNAFTDAYKATLDGLPAQGDMTKAVYDGEDNGIVDRAENQEIEVLNVTGSIIPRGAVLYVNGFSEVQELLTVILADRTLALPANGIATEEIAVAGSGKMVIQGVMKDLNTDGIPLDTILYLDTAGSYTLTRPTEGIIQPVGIVAYESATVGIVYIGLGSVFQPTLELWRANTPYITGNLIAAEDPYDTQSNKKFYRALREFTSAATFDPQRAGFDLDWELTGGDMSKSLYDTQERGIVDNATSEVVEVINNTGGPLSKGDLISVSGYDSVSGKNEIVLADHSTPVKADGMLDRDLLDTEEGLMIKGGELVGVDTFGEAIRATLYLSTAGVWTSTKPTTGIVQEIGYVTRADAALGRIKIVLEDQEIDTKESTIKGAFDVTGGTFNKIVHGSQLIVELTQATTYTLPLISGLTSTDYRVDIKNLSGLTISILTSGSDTIEGDGQVQLTDSENLTLYMKTSEYKIL